MTVSIVGVGLHPFGRFDISGREMGLIAAREALADAGRHERERAVDVPRLNASMTGLTSANGMPCRSTSSGGIEEM